MRRRTGVPSISRHSTTHHSTSRREFIVCGGALVASSLVTGLYPRTTAAQTSIFDFYISPTGSNSNPGTLSRPWALTALNARQASYAGRRVGIIGDRGPYNCLALAGGRYSGEFSMPFLMIPGGSASSSTVVASCNSSGVYVQGLAVLDAGSPTVHNSPNGQPLIGSMATAAGYGHITIDGLELRNGFNRLLSIGCETAVTAAPYRRLNGIIIQNCYIHGITNTLPAANASGITIYATDGAIVRNNFVTGMSDTQNRSTGIEFWTSINAATEFNTVISTNSTFHGGIVHKNIGQYDNVVRFNYINFSAAGPGNGEVTPLGGDTDGDGATTFTIHNNIVVADQPVQGGLMGGPTYPLLLAKQVWYNNTFVGIPAFSVSGWCRFGASRTISFYNNVISRTTVGGRGDVNTNYGALALIDYNLYPADVVLGLTVAGTSNWPNKVFKSLTTWGEAITSAYGRDAHSVRGNADFVGTGPHPAHYKLAPTSPGHGKATTNGQTNGAATDVGAWGNGATQIGSNIEAATV
jgi:hypothetical protein